ncbi:MAG: hypothetical protein R3F54_05065 [Alphaproteobacteria bacterium]
MIDRPLKLLLAGALAASSIAAASAQETGGVRIRGNVNSVTVVKEATNVANGSRAKAYMSIGSIHSDVDGRLEVHVDADRVTNYADGADETAVTSIGSVHKGARGSGEVVVHTGDVTNVSNGPGKASCVIIGSKGHVPECDQ